MIDLRFTNYDLRRAARIGCWLFGCLLAMGLLSGCSRPDEQFVTVYTSQDQIYSEPIFQEFTKQTGIKVRAVYDSEAVKTVGLVNRLLAEKNNPQCDVFWNNEELRTRQLAAQNLFRETNGWAAFGYRSRRVTIRPTRDVSFPQSLISLTNHWPGKVALAYPLFGTTATHFLALRQHWGTEVWKTWCRQLQANKPLLVDGNSVVVKFVGTGEALAGMTDSDDIALANRDGTTVDALPISAETLLIPNTVAVLRNAPHPDAAEKLFEFLQSKPVVDKLVAAKALEGASRDEVTTATLHPDWDKLIAELEPATQELKEIFLR